ncbi:MAG: hypothetical protein Q9209_002999 [Squamulea sp. 1 TL-2023]
MASTLHPLPPQLSAAVAPDELQKDLENAFSGAFPSGRTYEKVIAIFISWDSLEEQYPALAQAVHDLQVLLVEHYHYNFERVVLKTNDGMERRLDTLITSLNRYIERVEHDNALIILYYGGHGMIVRDNETHLTTTGGPMIGRSFGLKFTVKASLNFTKAMQASLELTKTDVIYLLDTCYHQTGVLSAGKELLAACSDPEHGNVVVEGNFTKHLVQVLQEQRGMPITLSNVHAKLRNRWADSTLVHTELHRDQEASLTIASLSPQSLDLLPSQLQQLYCTQLLAVDEPKALISARLDVSCIRESDEVERQIRRSLSTVKPPYIRDSEFSVSSIMPAFPSGLLVIIMVPAAVHNSMHGRSTYRHLGYVDGPVMLASATNSTDVQVPERD